MIAIVVPVYRHSVLLFDAIQSLAHTEGTLIVIVDDGCPDIETQFAGLGLAALHSHVRYLRGRNRGLSGARNRGIEFVLATAPAVEALYFLDADNMLSDWSLPQMRRMLAEQPEYDWFYPDIRMFGLEWEAEYAGAFSPLVESLINICEAGSLVRRRVFERGLRFSERLKLGFEDWDFWLSAIECGFRGLAFPASGFRYRKRPESMLANSTRDQSLIRGQLDQRHPWLLDLKWAVAAEHQQAPRYAIYLADIDMVHLTSSADAVTEELAWAAYVHRFWAAMRSPKVHHAGAIVVVTTSLNLAALRAARLLTWALFDIELRLRDANIAAIRLGRDAGEVLSIALPSIGPDGASVLAGLSMDLLRSVVADQFDTWIQSATSAEPMPRISCRVVQLSHRTPYVAPIGDMIRRLVRVCMELRNSSFSADSGLPAQDCSLGTPDRAQLNNMLRAKFGGGVLPPHVDRRRPEIAFALPYFEFGGVERVATFVAGALRRRGYVVSLLMLKSRSIQMSDAFDEAFDRVLFLDNQEFENWTGASYFGTALSRWSLQGEQSNELNLLSIFDAVIACHGGDVMGLMGGLRRRGVVTGAYVHLFDETETGRTCGHPHIALAFEYALDFFICCSRDIGLRMHALGVPASKIMTVPNAAGITIRPEQVSRSLRQRHERTGAKLNVLFLGRIDPQKGLDRLVAICEALRDSGIATIRIIGRPVLSQAFALGGLDDLLEDPVFGEHLIDAYMWADILLLPSLYEGLPLAVIEAMQLGVVPISARTGAIAEVIRDRHSGFIVSQEHCVAETLDRIAWLSADRARLHAMTDAAAAATRDWDDAVSDFETALRKLLVKGARAQGLRPGAATQSGVDPAGQLLADEPGDASPVSWPSPALL